MVFAIRCRESAMGVHVFPILNPPPTQSSVLFQVLICVFWEELFDYEESLIMFPVIGNCREVCYILGMFY